jgi:hypothetical protein
MRVAYYSTTHLRPEHPAGRGRTVGFQQDAVNKKSRILWRNPARELCENFIASWSGANKIA